MEKNIEKCFDAVVENENRAGDSFFKNDEEITENEETKDEPKQQCVPEDFDDIVADLLAEENQFHLEKPATLQSCADVYFAGCGVRFLKEKVRCNSCEEYFDGKISDGKRIPECHMALIRSRQLPYLDPGQGLKEPSYVLTQVTMLLLTICNKKFEETPHMLDLAASIFNEGRREIFIRYPDIFCCEDECTEHRERMIKYIIRSKVFNHFKDLSKSFRDKTSNSDKPKPNQKVRNLSHE